MTEPGSGDAQARPDAASASQPDPDSGPQPVPSRRELRQARRRGRRHPWLRRAMVAVAAGLALVLVLGAGVYVKLNGNIKAIDVSSQLGGRPKNTVTGDNKPLNILVMGVDTRDLGTDEFGKFKDTPGVRQDVTMLVHLSGDRQSAVVVSIPRDSMTHAPSDCKDPNSKVADGPIRPFNSNFGRGGPACVIKTVEGNTGEGDNGIFIDHFMVVNFVGFKSMVDALGEVEVCLPAATYDPESTLHLPAGRSKVSGDQALAFVRARYNVGNDASDLLRIKRQQAFLSSMVQEATSTNLLLRPDKLVRFLDAATQSLATDPGLASLNALREVAQSMGGLKSSQVRFVTVPNEPYPGDIQRVRWSKAADALWRSIHDDAPLPGTKPAPGSTPKPTSKPAQPVLTVTPDKITVQISNGSGVAGLAKQAADDLVLQGFKVKASVTGKSPETGVTVSYSGLNREKARTVAAAFPDAILVKDATVGDAIMVNLGAGSPNVVVVPNRVGSTPLPKHELTATSATPSSTATINARTADTDVCSG